MVKLEGIKISKKDVDLVLAEATPGSPASFSGDACKVYGTTRPIALIGVSILSFVHPPSAGAISALIAILDKACEKKV